MFSVSVVDLSRFPSPWSVGMVCEREAGELPVNVMLKRLRLREPTRGQSSAPEVDLDKTSRQSTVIQEGAIKSLLGQVNAEY